MSTFEMFRFYMFMCTLCETIEFLQEAAILLIACTPQTVLRETSEKYFDFTKLSSNYGKGPACKKTDNSDCCSHLISPQ